MSRFLLLTLLLLGSCRSPAPRPAPPRSKPEIGTVEWYLEDYRRCPSPTPTLHDERPWAARCACCGTGQE